MIKNWINWINISLSVLAVFFLLLSFGIHLLRPSEIPILALPPEKTSLPKGAFELDKDKYDRIGPPLLTLRFSPIALQLPDLRNYLIYYGRNERPDASPEQSMLHFSFLGSKEIASAYPEKPLYLVYDKDQPRIKYRFSPGNAPSSLWIEAIPAEKEATVNVAMKNEAGEIIRKPELFSQFKLKEKEFARFGAEKWVMGKWNVDGTLLARQRAKWFGKDLFLERHGGEEYKELKDKQRIDFGQDEDVYSVYITLGDTLAWKDDKWIEVKPEMQMERYPLLVIKAIEERLLKMELWDVDGKSKILLNLIKSAESALPQNIAQTFKFVGARTRSQFMFEVNNERMLIGPGDWLLFLNGKWINLKSSADIDNYVERKTIGPLFVIDKINRDEGKQALAGTLFNATRTEMKEIEIPLVQGTPPQTNGAKERQTQVKKKQRQERTSPERKGEPLSQKRIET